VKNRFQSLPFKCNLQRYTVVAAAEAKAEAAVGLHEFKSVDPWRFHLDL
jgi:hypothetical protein